ncbi:MAG: rod shape-determining protein MreC [Peptococcaceae bacterium]|jgi:rod shape-determining protein MreC|nr:rod shape-determining protein MreC [Peptococcaceae bacterium]
MKRWPAIRNAFFLVVVIALLLVSVRVTGAGRVTPLSGALQEALNPFKGSMYWVGGQVYNLTAYPLQLVHATAQNRLLKQQVTSLRNQVYALEEYKSEALRLENIMNYHPVYAASYGRLVAGVTGRNPGNWFQTLTINRGSKDHVAPNMPVVTTAGLVGRVLYVTAHTATVLLITDPRSGVGAMVLETRVPGIVEGVNAGTGDVRLANVPIIQNVQQGQTVVTSGTGSIFPRGIPIGTITRVTNEPAGLFKTATVLPFADLNRLDEVIVLVPRG